MKFIFRSHDYDDEAELVIEVKGSIYIKGRVIFDSNYKTICRHHQSNAWLVEDKYDPNHYYWTNLEIKEN